MGATVKNGPQKVMQSIVEGPDANCMQACLASYFGLPIEDVPILTDESWTQQVREWVRDLGFGFVTIAVPNEDVFKDSFSDGYLICSGRSARGRLHAVLYRDGRLWHDPHPDSNGIEKVESVDFFYPLCGGVIP